MNVRDRKPVESDRCDSEEFHLHRDRFNRDFGDLQLGHALLLPSREEVFDSLSSLVLNPIRRFLPPIGSIDISPMIAIFALLFLDEFLVETLFDLAVRLS